jgi:hypothetical protein
MENGARWSIYFSTDGYLNTWRQSNTEVVSCSVPNCDISKPLQIRNLRQRSYIQVFFLVGGLGPRESHGVLRAVTICWGFKSLSGEREALVISQSREGTRTNYVPSRSSDL